MHRPRAARTTMTEGVSPTDVRPELASQGNKPTGQSGPILSSGSSLPVRPSSLDARGSSAAKKAIGGGEAASYASGVNTTMATQFQGTVTQPQPRSASRASLVLPEAACSAVLRVLDSVAQRLVAVGISANAITVSCIALGCVGGVFLGFGQFGPAALVIVIASLGDALDGIVARRSHTASAAGALLDATGDRYQEFFLLGGLTVYFRGFTFGLVMTLLAIAGSFMVSYSSAKAEAMGLPVPPGVMRRPERAVCMGHVASDTRRSVVDCGRRQRIGASQDAIAVPAQRKPEFDTRTAHRSSRRVQRSPSAGRVVKRCGDCASHAQSVTVRCRRTPYFRTRGRPEAPHSDAQRARGKWRTSRAMSSNRAGERRAPLVGGAAHVSVARQVSRCSRPEAGRLAVREPAR
jgi:phosphatidylglycerophosphate synthase